MSEGVPDWQRLATKSLFVTKSDLVAFRKQNFSSGLGSPRTFTAHLFFTCSRLWCWVEKRPQHPPLTHALSCGIFAARFLCLRVNKGLSEMLRILAVALSLSLLNLLPAATPPALAGDTIIKCKIKGVGVRNFKLEDGIWSDKVWVRKNNTDWKEWCPETEKQNLKVGGDEMFCMVANVKHRDMVIWGRTILNFEDPSWKMRYRFAKPGQAYVDSAPGGREDATCKAWKD